MKPDLLVCGRYRPAALATLGEHFTVHHLLDPRELDRIPDELAAKVAAVTIEGSVGLRRSQIERLPRLEIVVTRGTGLEGVDLEATRERNIVVTNNPGANAASVADHALALLLAVMRELKDADRAVSDGRWNEFKTARPSPPTLTGKRVGILGLGLVGMDIARRLQGFDVEISYHNRTRRDDVAYAYRPDPVSLATQADVLIVSCPGGPATFHLVGRSVLDALGPRGFMVNVGRGSVVDTTELVTALEEGRIAGAGLDVVEGEPAPSPALRHARNLIVTPHMGWRSAETETAMYANVLHNLKSHFSRSPAPQGA